MQLLCRFYADLCRVLQTRNKLYGVYARKIYAVSIFWKKCDVYAPRAMMIGGHPTLLALRGPGLAPVWQGPDSGWPVWPWLTLSNALPVRVAGFPSANWGCEIKCTILWNMCYCCNIRRICEICEIFKKNITQHIAWNITQQNTTKYFTKYYAK